MKNKYIKLVFLLLAVSVSVSAILLLSSCSTKQELPIGVWTSENPYMEIDFGDGSNDITCAIMVNGDKYVFKDVFRTIDGSPFLDFGEYIPYETSEGESVQVGDQGSQFEMELGIQYKFTGDEFIVEIYSSKYPDQYPIETKLTLTPK